VYDAVLEALVNDENVPNKVTEVTEASISTFLGNLRGKRRDATTSQVNRGAPADQL
jgi:hypothetical protein